MVGRKLSQLLLKRTWRVRGLSRNPSPKEKHIYHWNPSTMEISSDALDGVTDIIHLAGAGVADKRWTRSRKQLLVQSRTQTANLLLEKLKSNNHRLQTFISASAQGIYPYQNNSPVSENDPKGKGFIAELCEKWEEATNNFESIADRVVIYRLGIVLDAQQGALPKMSSPLKWGVQPVFGSGEFISSWIHIDDVCSAIIHALENKLTGPFNLAAPKPVSHLEMMNALKDHFNVPALQVKIPPFLLKAMMGEMSCILTQNCHLSIERLRTSGFKWQFPNLEEALNDIYPKHPS